MDVDAARLEPSRTTFSTDDVLLGEFNLLPGHPRWSGVNVVEPDRALIAFPGTAVEIHQAGARAVIADAERAVTYAPGTEYRRALVSPAGDRCAFMAVSRELAAEAAGPFDISADDPQSYRFPFTAVSVSDADFLLKQRVRARVLGGDFDRGEVRERLYWLVHRTVSSGYRALGHARKPRRPGTDRLHAELVEGVRRLIGGDPAARMSLDQLAATLHTSPFHLSRTFRSRTGRSVHAYRTDVRLRGSLELIADGARLADVALEFGFASQAHLTDRLRRRFNVTPDAWRRSLRGRREMSTILKEDHDSAA